MRPTSRSRGVRLPGGPEVPAGRPRASPARRTGTAGRGLLPGGRFLLVEEVEVEDVVVVRGHGAVWDATLDEA